MLPSSAFSMRLRVLAASLLALAACNRPDGGGAAAASRPDPSLELGPEDVVRVEPKRLEAGPPLSGALRVRQIATIRAEVSGAVLESQVEAGQRVAPNQPLMRLDDKGIQEQLIAARSAVRSARNALQVAEQERDRAQRLADAGGVARRDLERAEAAVAQQRALVADALARLTLARQQLGRTRIAAPFTGVVSEVHARRGDIVQPGTPLFTVVDPSTMRLEATVPASGLEQLRPGAAVDFSVTGYGDRRFRGWVTDINPLVDPASRQVRLYVELPNPGGDLLGGLHAQGRVATQTREGLAAPLSAVDLGSRPPTVLRLEQGRARRVPVELGLRDELSEQVELVSGVSEGDLLVAGAARARLAAGAPVRVRAAEGDERAARRPAPPAPQGSGGTGQGKERAQDPAQPQEAQPLPAPKPQEPQQPAR